MSSVGALRFLLVSEDIITWDPQKNHHGLVVLDAANLVLEDVAIGDLVMVPTGIKAIQLAFTCLKNKDLPIAISTYASVKMKMLDFCQRLQHDNIADLDQALIAIEQECTDEAKKHRQSFKRSDENKARTWASEFKTFIKESRAADPAVSDVRTLEAKIRDVIFAVDAPNQNDDTPEDEPDIDRDRARFSTVHCAKGLGHKNVFWLPGCDEPSHIDALTRIERNLFYVALTRSKQNLCVVGKLPFFL